MKQFIVGLILCLTFCSCHKEPKKRPRSVMSSETSLVNQWYGKDHFKPRDSNLENKSLNELDKDESNEVDAGKVEYQSTEEVVRVKKEPSPSETQE